MQPKLRFFHWNLSEILAAFALCYLLGSLSGFFEEL